MAARATGASEGDYSCYDLSRDGTRLAAKVQTVASSEEKWYMEDEVFQVAQQRADEYICQSHKSSASLLLAEEAGEDNPCQ